MIGPVSTQLRSRTLLTALAALVAGAGMLLAAYALASGGEAGAAAAKSRSCFGRTVTILGRRGDDAGHHKLKGTRGSDVIDARGGDDEIVARSGRDLICAGRGKDAVHGNTGNDKASGDAGSDLMLGDKGSDHLYGKAGDDALGGGPGKPDLCAGGPGDDLANRNDCEHITGAHPVG